jgi:sigma-70-like protein
MIGSTVGFNGGRAPRSKHKAKGEISGIDGKVWASPPALGQLEDREEHAMVADHKFRHPEFRKKVTDCILEMLAQLAEADRNIFVWSHYHGCQVELIAEVLGRSSTEVETRLGAISRLPGLLRLHGICGSRCLQQLLRNSAWLGPEYWLCQPAFAANTLALTVEPRFVGFVPAALAVGSPTKVQFIAPGAGG